jgi:nitrogen fixation NifU-like protein
MTQAGQGDELTQEIIEHMMHPRNYGKLDDPDGVGIGYDEVSGEYVIFYLGIENDTVERVAFSTNGCQDTVILGSIFTEMIKGIGIEEARRTAERACRRSSKTPRRSSRPVPTSS